MSFFFKFPNLENYLDLKEIEEKIGSKTYKSKIMDKYKEKKLSKNNYENFELVYQAIREYSKDYLSSNESKKSKRENNIASILYNTKSVGWSTGLISEKALQIKRPTPDHIFSRKLIAKYYLNKFIKKEFSLEYLINTYTNLYGLTNKVTSEENTNLGIVLQAFLNGFNSEIENISILLPLISCIYYHKCKIILEKEIKKRKRVKPSINNPKIKKYVLDCFLTAKCKKLDCDALFSFLKKNNEIKT